LTVKINGNRGAQQKTLFQQEFQKKLYNFNRNSQRSDWTSGVGQKIRLLVLLGIRLHPKTYDSDSAILVAANHKCCVVAVFSLIRRL